MKEAKDDLVRYRITKARETIEDARILANANRWNPCVNRLYYACFYAVSALLIQHDLSSARHTGIRSLFNQHFVKTEKVSKKFAQIYNDLFERRQESDYMDFIHFEEKQVSPWIGNVEQFVENVAVLIEGKSD
ncbi:MAG: HEPN domain-containing protein [Deltaproteobacteria bacterium]|jgi:uncharacterized protein (UPF0332 family)|nr:HEPN domain-containing protein [Deltaproteobacteria bacterium]